MIGNRFAILANPETEDAFTIEHKGLVMSAKSSVTEFGDMISMNVAIYNV